MSELLKVSFHFHPFKDGDANAVEKEESGRKRRYLRGVSSGLLVDGAGERMTARCIKSFQDQAATGDVLLYGGRHGVDFTDDFGKLVKSEIMPDGNWMTEYRLYDELDQLGPSTLEKADKVWRQIIGLPPYTRPKQKGFSIEGVIPEGGLQTVDGNGRRVMESVELDGVLLVSRPAYKDSIARAVYKTLGLVLPGDMRHGLSSSIATKIKDAKERDDYYGQYFTLQGALDDQVHYIMKTNSPERADQLRTLFSEYGDLMVGLTMRSEQVFKDDSATGGSGLEDPAFDAHPTRIKRLTAATTLVHKMLKQHGVSKVSKTRTDKNVGIQEVPQDGKGKDEGTQGTEPGREDSLRQPEGDDGGVGDPVGRRDGG